MLVHTGPHTVHHNDPIVLPLAIFIATLGLLALVILLYFAMTP